MREISVIIPTYNRPDDLGRVLDSYYVQDGVLEIIVIDDASELDYSETINRFNKKYNEIPLRYTKNSRNLGAGASRNVGIRLAQGKYILWGEDDAFLAQDYTKVLLSKMDSRKVLFGSIYYGIFPEMPLVEKGEIIEKQRNSNRPVFDYETFEGYYRKKMDDDSVVPYGHALILVPSEVYRHVGYFEGYRVNGYREETDAQVQMTKLGYEIIYTTDTECYHFPPVNKKGGQHHSNRLRYEYYKVINNNLFLERHYSFLKEKYGLKKGMLAFKVEFDLFVLKGIVKGMVGRLKGLFK